MNRPSRFTQARFEATGTTRRGRPLYRVYGLAFDVGRVGSGATIRVDEGFETDGPSWPWWVDAVLAVIRAVLPPEARPVLADLHMVKSSALHDFMRERLGYTKLTGDAIFLSAMQAEGTMPWLRWLAFVAVLCNFSRARATE